MVAAIRLPTLILFASMLLCGLVGQLVQPALGAEVQPHEPQEPLDPPYYENPLRNWDDCPVPDPWVNVTGQLLWLTRDMTEVGQTLILETYGNIPAPVQAVIPRAGTEDIHFEVEAGFRGSVLLGPPTARMIEFSYLGIYDQTADMILTIPGPAAVPVDPLEIRLTGSGFRFFNSDFASTSLFDWSVSYNSTMHSAEVNLWCEDTWRFRPILGVRWIQQAEQFDITSTITPSVGGASEVTNNLMGAQLGFLAVLWRRTDWFRAQAICKAGCYHNDIDFGASVFSAGTTLAAMQTTSTSTAYSGEINITALWQLGPHLNFHVGYTGIWLTEVASIGDQFTDLDIATGAGQFDLRGVSYQGGHLGCTVSW